MSYPTLTLRESIEELYNTFGEYPLPRDTKPCQCCHSHEDAERISSKLLRRLSVDDLNQYAFDALLTWGDARTFKHLMPRIMELFVAEPPAETFAINPEIILSKFRHGNWKEWPEGEQTAVRAFLHALWRDFLRRPYVADYASAAEEWLCSIAQAEDDLSSYLSDWLQDDGEEACRELAALVITTRLVEGEGAGKHDGFWKERQAQYSQLEDWVDSAAVREKLIRASQKANPEAAQEYAAALQMLD
jgi:hypothetical protein